MNISRTVRRFAAAASLTAVVGASAVAPANAWENSFDASVGNQGQCALTFTAQEKDDINAAYKLLFETMAGLSYERINDLKNKQVWYEWAKKSDQKDLVAPGPLGPVTNAQTALFAGKDSGTYVMTARFLEQSRKDAVPAAEVKLTPAEAADLKGAGAVKTSGLVAPGLWALVRGSLSLSQASDVAGEALNKLGPRIHPTIKSYEEALTACEERETTKGDIKQGSSLDTDQFVGLVVGGIAGGLALLGLIAVGVGPLVNDFFTKFWKNAGVLR